MSTGKETAGDGVSTGINNISIDPAIKSNLKVEESVQVTCFSEVSDDLTLHFQIIRLPNQIYAWIGCNSAKFGHLYAAAPTRPNNTVSVASLLAGASDNTGSGIARRIVIKTGLNVILACNIPKDNPMLEVNAEKRLVQKLIELGYAKPKSKGLSS
ncbi:proteasome assembly chaperone 4 [Heracleum sosnowskyi]|uniref:Proteasome assembly chaperone 4 n=1 Tax=Heracleum sosnowskyi TaxID=360622 RepID=A0AAD8IQP0_9APIA|nr:proteasome assembly chaperone 4 [Heracleum sosnowskyi]